MQWCNTLHKVTVSILFPHIINDQVWTFRACEIADLEIFKCDFKTTLNPQCKSLSLFSKPRGGRLIWSLKARHIKKTYSIGYSLLIGPWKKYQKTFLINDIRNWMFLSQRPCLESLSVYHFVSETSSFGVMKFTKCRVKLWKLRFKICPIWKPLKIEKNIKLMLELFL